MLKNIKNLLLISLVSAVLLAVSSVAFSQTAYAVEPIPAGCPGSTLQGPPGPGVCESIPLGCPGSTQQGPPGPGFDINTCPYGVDTGFNGDDGTPPEVVKNDCNESNGDINQSNCGIIRYLVIFINLLSAVVGVVVMGSIIFGGIQYSMAGSDPQKVSAAKNRIRNAIIALIFFIFSYSFLNYLVPGGVL